MRRSMMLAKESRSCDRHVFDVDSGIKWWAAGQQGRFGSQAFLQYRSLRHCSGASRVSTIDCLSRAINSRFRYSADVFQSLGEDEKSFWGHFTIFV